MPKSRIPSPARSQSALVTPRRAKTRGSRSVTSPARSNTSVKLTSLIQNFKDKNMDSFHLSPLNSRRSVLNDNTDIEEPKRNSWWKKLNDTSRDIMEVLESDKQDPYNVIDEYMDVEVLSQEKKDSHSNLNLPDSSDNESISSIVVPQRKLFSQKENHPQPQKKFAQFLGPRESMAKLNKTSGPSDKSEKTIVAGTKKIFGQSSKPRSKPAFPTELLRFSPDKTVNKTAGEIKGQVRNLFGNRAGVKRKNNFADFIASESEEEPEIQPKVFGFQKKNDVPTIRVSTASQGNRDYSPTSSVTTDIDMDDWKLLPSSTMVQTQLEAMITDSPAKKARLSKLSEGRETEAATNSTAITNKTKLSNKSITSKNKSKMPMSKNSMNKTKTSPKRSDDENIKKTIVNEEIPEHIDQEVENEENEVSLHYSDDDPQEDHLEYKNENDATNKTKRSTKSATPRNKSKMSTSIGSLNKSKISVCAQKCIRNEANVAEKNVNKSKEKNDSKREKAVDEVQEEESLQGANEIQDMEDEHQESKVEQEDKEQEDEKQEMGDENQDSEVEQEDEELVNKSQEVEDENQESEVEQEDEEEIESDEMEDENRDSEIEQEAEEQENVSQEMEDDNQELEDEVQGNGSQEVDIAAPVNDDEQNNSREVVVVNQDKEIENMEVDNKDKEIDNMEVDNEAVVSGTATKTNQCNQSITSVNTSKTSLLINKSKISAKANVGPNIMKTAFDDGEIELHNEGNYIFRHGDGDAQGIDNMELNNDNDLTNKTKHSNESVTSKDKSKMSVSKNLMNKANNSPNKSVNKSKLSISKSPLNSKPKSLSKSKENDNLSEHVADEDQVDADNEEIVKETLENGRELEKEQEDGPEVENESQEIDVHNQLSEHEEEEQDIEDIEQGNESQEEVNESEEVESECEDEEEGIEQDEGNNEDEDEQNETEEVENKSQEIEDQSEEDENKSQEVDNDESEDEEENEDAEELEVEKENESQEEIDEDVDDQQESNEVMDESDEQIDAENDNHESEEEENATEEGTPNIKSPEAILHDNTSQMESFTAKGRNTSIRRTSMIKSLNIRHSEAPPRESTGFSDGTKNSSAEGSGWDSHRITKKTLRQTFGRDFTPRKSLRALVMEKSAKRHTEFTMNDVDMPRANSTELPDDTRGEPADDAHDVSRRTRQTTLEMYLQKIKRQNMEKRIKLEEEIRNSLKAPKESSNPFSVPSRAFAQKRAKPKTKAVKTVIPLDNLPPEFIEDMKYKPPRRFQPSNASWTTKRLYKFLESKLEAKYDYKARIRAEKLVETIYKFTKDLRRHTVAPGAAVDALKKEMARLDIVRTHFEFYQFFHDYMPREVRVKVNPDVVNQIPLPREGVFADILRGKTVQG